MMFLILNSICLLLITLNTIILLHTLSFHLYLSYFSFYFQMSGWFLFICLLIEWDIFNLLVNEVYAMNSYSDPGIFGFISTI